MSAGRLLPDDITDEIAIASTDRRRRIAIAVAALALDALPSRFSELDRALAAIQSGTRDSTTRDLVASVAQRLDQRYFELYDDEKHGGRSPGWEDAFRAARAATALGFAFDDNATAAGADAVLEALHSLGGDLAAIRSTVLSTP